MPAANHPAYQEELERCRYTLGYVNKTLDSMLGKKQKIEKEIERLKRHRNQDSSQDYIDLMINTQLSGNMSLKIRNLVTAQGKPYFARVDFKEKGREETEKLYIGKMSLAKDEDQQIIIVDWRAPVANLYYEERLGCASYQCPDGDIKGDLLLKRQFSINSGELQEIFDIDITTSDEFLQSYLGASADNRLKEIVSTIQVEQNKIIRSDMWKPLIVQGAAGSGKTTIALHRIAYLIYTYEKSFEPENFMIIAPNRLFLNYISEVLPELGVERVKQTTFDEFASELLGKKFKLKEPNEKLTKMVSKNSYLDNSIPLLQKSSEFKSSIRFKEVLDGYIRHIEESFIPREDFKVFGIVIYPYNEINQLFLKEYKRWPIAQRIHEIKKHLQSRLVTRKDNLINSLHDQCDETILSLKSSMEDSDERQVLIIKAIDEKNENIKKIETLSKKAVNEYVKKISKLSPWNYYVEFYETPDLFHTFADASEDRLVSEYARTTTLASLTSGYVEVEDYAPLIYLKYCIYGMDEKIPVKHIVIDEAQDFSVFQLYVLKKIVKDSSYTILGDLCQGIHSYRGIKSWDDVITTVFDDRKSDFLTLEQSYRTTVEIMDAANSVLKKLDDKRYVLAKPVIRHGEAVQLIHSTNIKSTAADMVKKITRLRDDGFKSIAIICKTLEECKQYMTLLKKDIDEIHTVTGKEDQYKGGIVVVPSYLSKGLEFDAVMISDASSDMYQKNELDIKLLYVAMTRPLHKLYIYYQHELSLLLDNI